MAGRSSREERSDLVYARRVARVSAQTRLLRWWEDLPIVTQLIVAGVPLILLLWALNVGPMNQPMLRGLGYGIFEGSIAAGAVFGATRSERARRLAREASEDANH